MLIWLKNSLTPQEIRDRILDPSSDFQKKLVEYLESVHMGEFVDTNMNNMFSEMEQGRHSGLPHNTDPPFPCPSVDACTFHDEDNDVGSCDCLDCASWWDYFTHTVNELLWRCNVHDCRYGCRVDKGSAGKTGSGRRTRCKARFPRATRSTTSIDPETGYLLLKKGEAWLNTFTPVLTYILRCNSDVTCLLSGTAVKAVVAYVTDYITKSPLKTHTMFEALRTSFKK
ncbi:hypothetical protein PHLGIDRAFT_58734, partial [Phlebiopsis gigantea 11061_1 CR5-6]